MGIRVLFFAEVAEAVGADDLNMDEIPADIVNLKQNLEARFITLAGMRYAVAVNHEVVHDNHKLENGDEVAFLPPFSGG